MRSVCGGILVSGDTLHPRFVRPTIVLLVVLVASAIWSHLPPRPRGEPIEVIVDKSHNRLFVYEHGRLVRTYEVATGRSPTLTPEGRFHIASKAVDPYGGLAQDSQFGSRWMGICTPDTPDGSRYGIHGTNEPDSIGKYASAGCIRMHTQDIEELFLLVDVGTPVEIIAGNPLAWVIRKTFGPKAESSENRTTR